MINRRIVLYVVALTTLAAIVLGLVGLAGPAIAVLAVAVAGMFGWVVLWARAQNAQLARIGAALERRETVDDERSAALTTALGGLDRFDARLDAYARDTARRAGAHDDRIQRVHREVLEVASLLQRTPSTTNELYRVYRRLVHHEHPMPVLGGWAMTSSTLVWITDQISSGHVSTILECGSGSSTVWFALALEQRGGDGRIVSLESNADYADETRSRLAELGLGHRALVLTAPLVPLDLPERDTQRWFDHTGLPGDLTGADLLFVDGPVGSTAPLARYPALPVLADRLSADAYVVLDDSSRGPEQQILKLWTDGDHAGRHYRVVHELDRATVLRADVPAPTVGSTDGPTARPTGP